MNMKRIALLTFLLICLVPAALLFGIDSPLFDPVTPEVIAQGSSFTAVAKGYNSLFTNPAGFARKGGSFTLLSATANSYIPVEGIQGIVDFASSMDSEGETAETTDTATDEDPFSPFSLLQTNGIGAGLNVGAIGIVGKGLGIGIASDVDLFGRGDRLLSTEMNLAYTTAVIAGLAFPLRLGFADFYIGADVRYMLRTEMALGINDILGLMAGGEEEDTTTTEEASVLPIVAGTGLGIDFGIIAESGPFTVGFSIRDLGGTTFDYTQAGNITIDTIGDSVEGILTGSVDGVAPEEPYTIPMTISYGAGFHPDFGGFSFLIDPVFHFEVKDTLWADREPDFWTKVHAGTEIRVLRFIKLRAGINQGYTTLGAGVKLLFLDVNASYFTREMSDYPGFKPNEGFSLEAAIRF